MVETEKRALFFSGAGLSAESGLATFRANDGLWASYDINVVCNYHTWEANFELVHEFYNKRRTELAKVEPNEAHKIIAQIQQKYGSDRVCIITQNVDDLLERAGCVDVIHVHGELTKLRCTSCEYVWDVGYVEYSGQKCKKCGSDMIKPFVVFFYESAPMYRVMYREFERLTPNDVALIVGTSGNVISPNMLLGGSSAYKILNNLEPSDAIDESIFDELYYESAITAMVKIKSIVDEKLKTRAQ